MRIPRGRISFAFTGGNFVEPVKDFLDNIKSELIVGMDKSVEEMIREIFKYSQQVVPKYTTTLKRSGRVVTRGSRGRTTSIVYDATKGEQWDALSDWQRDNLGYENPHEEGTTNESYAAEVDSYTEFMVTAIDLYRHFHKTINLHLASAANDVKFDLDSALSDLIEVVEGERDTRFELSVMRKAARAVRQQQRDAKAKKRRADDRFNRRLERVGKQAKRNMGIWLRNQH